jgi:RNA polymerase sigma-70 factor, ECF subfamily
MNMGDDGYSLEDGELVGRAKTGDRGAFGQLVLRHQRRVFALGLRWFRNADDADDLVQETFVRAWRALDRFDETRPFAPWLLTIAANRARTMLGRARPSEELHDSIMWEGPSPAEDAERARLESDVQTAMKTLPQEQRVVLHMRAVESLSYREISDALDIPIGTVMSRLARAREEMRRKLGRVAERDV